MNNKLVVIGWMLLMSVAVPLRGQTPVSSQRALLNQYCVSCHNAKQKSAGLALDKLDLDHVSKDAEVWEKVVHKVRAGMQPPSGRPRPDAATLEAFVVWL